MMIDERALIPISAVNALKKKVRQRARACVVNEDRSLFEDVLATMMGN